MMTIYAELRNAVVTKKVTNEYEKHPRCAILFSPEKLNESYNSQGQDATNTRRDFNDVCEWARKAGFLNTEFFVDAINVDENQLLEETVYKSLINFAFGSVVDPIRNTFSPEDDEMVLLYYTGHGLDGQSANMLNADLPDGQSSSPLLHNHYFKIAENRTSDRTVKGGELCLHDVGFCDLMGLLTPWIAAVNEESRNAPGVKKNKHLVVIADSCYSGVLVQDLEQLAKTSGPWNANGCTVTVQSACGSGEPTVGGYFTPCFIHFNEPENQLFLQELKNEWNGKSEEEKNAYRAVDLPSERLVATTMPSERLISKDPILLLPVIQGLTLTLFPDAGFFKFCFLSFSGIVGSKVRALTPPAIDTFLSQVHFTILDYKLKIIANGTPMALVLVDDPNDTTHVVCVHIHFYNTTTDLGNVSRVNLVHRNRPTSPDYLSHLLWREDTPDDLDCLGHQLWGEDTSDDTPDDTPDDAPDDAPDDTPDDTPNDTPDDAPDDDPNDTPNDTPDDTSDDTSDDISHGKWKFDPPLNTELVELVKQCKDYVEKNDPSGIWADSTRWNMEQSFNNLFRLKERSTWMEDYVKKTTEKNSQAQTLCIGYYIFGVCIIIISMVLAYVGYY